MSPTNPPINGRTDKLLSACTRLRWSKRHAWFHLVSQPVCFSRVCEVISNDFCTGKILALFVCFCYCHYFSWCRFYVHMNFCMWPIWSIVVFVGLFFIIMCLSFKRVRWLIVGFRFAFTSSLFDRECLTVCLFQFFVGPSVSLSVCPSVGLSDCLSVCLSVFPFVFQFQCLCLL